MFEGPLLDSLLLLARSDGIAVTLTPLSKAIVGGLFLVVLGAVVWVISYRKPDGAAYEDDTVDREPPR